LGAAAGWWELEKETPDAGYAKVKIGNTYYDPWMGIQQFVTFTSRILGGYGISSQTGSKYKVDFIDELVRLARSKGAPGITIAVDFRQGTTMTGEKTDPKNVRQWVERFTPMAPYDIYEAWYELGLEAALQVMVPAFQGLGVTTYETNTPTEKQVFRTRTEYETTVAEINRRHEFKDYNGAATLVRKYPELGLVLNPDDNRWKATSEIYTNLGKGVAELEHAEKWKEDWIDANYPDIHRSLLPPDRTILKKADEEKDKRAQEILEEYFKAMREIGLEPISMK